MVKTEVSLDEMLRRGGKLTIESEESPEDAKHRRRKDWVLFLMGVCLFALLTLAALAASFGPWTSPAQQDIGKAVLLAAISASAGFVVGRKAG